MIATIVIDYVTGRYWFWFNKPTYTGNLLGGSISGEHTGTTLERFCKVRKDASLRLYIKLYRDAVGEQDVEMAYYRFWAILEALARTKNLSGCQKLDRQGVPLLNRQGTPCYVNNQAEPLVMELLRRVHFGPKYSMVDPLGHLFDLVPIWYRHRNCIAHGGGCRPDDPIHCHRNKEQFVRCRDMHIKVVEGSGMPRGRHADQLLRTLESEAQLAVMQEFCGSGSI